MTVNFLKKGIRVNGEYFPVWYNIANDGKVVPVGTITIYVKTYQHIPAGAFAGAATVENDTEIISDYIEKDRIRLLPGTAHYAAAKKAAGF